MLVVLVVLVLVCFVVVSVEHVALHSLAATDIYSSSNRLCTCVSPSSLLGLVKILWTKPCSHVELSRRVLLVSSRFLVHRCRCLVGISWTDRALDLRNRCVFGKSSGFLVHPRRRKVEAFWTNHALSRCARSLCVSCVLQVFGALPSSS